MPLLKPAAVFPRAPQQYSQPSRKGKRTWRKNVDVSDVQEGLENVRDEVIKGGVIAEKDSTELFTLDIAGDVELRKKYYSISKPLKADEIISQRSTVPVVTSRKNPSGRSSNLIGDQERKRISYVSHKELIRLRNVANGHHESESVVEATEPLYDPWDQKWNNGARTQDPRFSFLPAPEMKKAPKTLQHKPISLAASGKDIPAVIKPAGGYSYNPLYSHYEERLITEGNREVEAEKFRLAAGEVERLNLERAAGSAAEAEAAEAKGDLSEWDEESAWEGFENVTENIIFNMKRPERKTPSQRNRIKRRREEERKAKMLVVIKRKQGQAAQAKNIAKGLAEREEHRIRDFSQDHSSSSEGEDLELRRRKLGRISLPERQLELVLPDELQDSLRLLKPEGNLLKDRYRSFLIRGKLEARKPVSYGRKAKMKSTEKWTHKDFMLP